MGTPKARFFRKCIVLLSLVFLSLNAGIAEAKYKPKGQKPPKDSSISTGTRSGCDTQITLLAPQVYVGQTSSTRPKLVWNLSSNSSTDEDKTYDLILTIFEILPDKRKIMRVKPIEFQARAGIVQQSLTGEQVDLEVGKTYLWQVASPCSGGNYNVHEAEIEVTAMPSELKKRLLAVKDPVTKANLYAEEGYWYEALAETIPPAGQPGADFSALFQVGRSLLGDLAEAEKEFVAFKKSEGKLTAEEESAVQEKAKVVTNPPRRGWGM
ncbi:DUF928 domain-containing protein [Merismopedia glauca]|uniref:DUF928 domain-containing protein n=1 Tax=Merismopedia glauca CCAP 1448/3 TaxID=1296344 RepID=A0A2T1C0U3_9CYAN|nr:DUF928 domain-containing protein [Merismopedia glauca]PSB01862.1 hypothetical protein C7B64_16150 [Merismopedia glauca CCAP 1448/3]